MGLLREAGVELAVAAIAFILGLLLNRLLRTWAYLRARNFWRPLVSRDLALVLGDGFPDLPPSFEASGVVGQGDLLASTELIAHFSAMGLPKLSPVFADRTVGGDPGGRGLRRNLVLLGGQDANTLTKACLLRLKCSYELEWPQDSQNAASTLEVTSGVLQPSIVEASGEEWRPPRLRPTEYAEGTTQVYEPVAADKKIVRDYGVIIRARNPFLFEGRQDKRVVLIYGCYGFGTRAAVLFSMERAFLDLVKNTDEDIECIVSCDVIDREPHGLRHVFIRNYPAGALCKEDFLDSGPPASTRHTPQQPTDSDLNAETVADRRSPGAVPQHRPAVWPTRHPLVRRPRRHRRS